MDLWTFHSRFIVFSYLTPFIFLISCAYLISVLVFSTRVCGSNRSGHVREECEWCGARLSPQTPDSHRHGTAMRNKTPLLRCSFFSIPAAFFFFLHNAVRSDNRIFWKDMRSSDLCDCVRLFKWDLWLQQWKLMKLVLSVRDAVTLIRMKLHYEENPLPPRLALSSSLSLTHTLTLTHTKSYMSVHHV